MFIKIYGQYIVGGIVKQSRGIKTEGGFFYLISNLGLAKDISDYIMNVTVQSSNDPKEIN